MANLGAVRLPEPILQRDHLCVCLFEHRRGQHLTYKPPPFGIRQKELAQDFTRADVSVIEKQAAADSKPDS